MKKITLMMLALLAVLTGFAQGSDEKEVVLTWQASQMEWTNSQTVSVFSLAPDLQATADKAAGSNAPAYYDSGTALRLYAGNTLTIAGKAITRIEVVMTGNEKQQRLEGDGYADGVWTGQSDQVTLTVPAGSGNQARIQKLVVSYTSAYEPADVAREVPTEPVALPEGAVTLPYTLEAYGEESTDDGQQDYNVKRSVQVVFYGNDVYIQGLSYFFPEAWVKGTVSGTKAVFKSPQLYGTDDEGSVYFWGYDWASDQQLDVVFDYDPDKRTLTTYTNILENGDALERYCFDYFYYTRLYPGEPASTETVELPEGVQPVEYHFAGYESYYERDEAFPVNVAFDGADVYIQGLSPSVPEAWAKGVLADDGNITFSAAQYLGAYETPTGPLDIFFSGATFSYDAQTGIISCPDGYTTETDQIVWDEFAHCVLTPVSTAAATPVAPAISSLDYDESFGYYIHLDIPLESTDGRYLQSDGMAYQLFYDLGDGQARPYVLSSSDYENLQADMSLVPYNFDDDWDVYRGGVTLYLYGDVPSWQRIGVQSVYTAAGETHASAIVWVDMTALGIAPTAATQTPGTQRYDLQGRRITGKPAKGLYIQNGRKYSVR